MSQYKQTLSNCYKFYHFQTQNLQIYINQINSKHNSKKFLYFALTKDIFLPFRKYSSMGSKQMYLLQQCVKKNFQHALSLRQTNQWYQKPQQFEKFMYGSQYTVNQLQYFLYKYHMQEKAKQTIDQYRICDYILQGATAKVFRAVGQKNQQVAIKAYIAQNFSSQCFQNESKILRKFAHTNIVSMKDKRQAAIHRIQQGKEQKIPIIIMQYVDGKELFDYINITKKFPEKFARYYFADMINVLSYMNKEGYAHLDIKIQNIMLTNKCTLKLIDFGLASPIKGVDFSKHKIGSEGYMAPEIGSGNFDPIKADIFSAGVILFLMCTAQLPFKSPNNKNDLKYQFIKQGKYKNFWHKFKGHNLSDEFQKLFQKLVAYDPKKRPTLQQICEDPWMNKEYPTIQEIRKQFTAKFNEIQNQNKDNKEKLYQLHKNRQNSGSSTRSSKLDQKFNDIYKQQQKANPVLTDIGDLGKQGFYINLEKNFALANLKIYLKEVEIKAREIDPESLFQQKIPVYKLKSMEGSNYKGYEIIVTLCCVDVIEPESDDEQDQDITIQQELVAKIQIGQNAKGQIGFKFKLQQGSYIVYKKFIYGLKAQFLDCMIENN